MWEVMKEYNLIVYRQLAIFNVFKKFQWFLKKCPFFGLFGGPMRAKKDFVVC